MSRVDNRPAAESELQRALDCGELIPWYQPVVDLATGDLVQVEALLRWQHLTRGLLAPHDFLFDENDPTVLVRIGWSVVIEATRQAAEWRAAHPDRPITVSVNLFDDHLDRRELATRVQSLLDGEVVAPRPLAFEVGERHLAPGRSRARDRRLSLHNVGVELALDDFGAAAAAGGAAADELRDGACERLERVGALSIALVKLDATFVARLATEARLAQVVDAAHAAGVRVVATGVEDEDVAGLARRVGADLGQGFHFARPLPAARIDELLTVR